MTVRKCTTRFCLPLAPALYSAPYLQQAAVKLVGEVKASLPSNLMVSQSGLHRRERRRELDHEREGEREGNG